LDFTRETQLVFLAGGIGLTPLISMLHALLAAGSKREIWLFYGVRNGNEHLFKETLEELNRENENLHLHVCYSRPAQGEVPGKDFQHTGRISLALLKSLLPSCNYDFYLCGPGTMMHELAEGLKAWDVPEHSIRLEAFGPASVQQIAPRLPSAPVIRE